MDKLTWHKLNHKFIKRHAVYNNHMWGSYFEVADGTTPQSYGILVEDPVTKCLPPKGFIAVNHKPKAITGHPAPPPYSLICDDAFRLAIKLSGMTPEALRAKGIPAPVVVFNFDMQNNADVHSEFWPLHWEQLHEIALNTYERNKLCVVILNMALHRRFLHSQELSVSQAVERHATKVLETFRDLPVRGLTQSALLGNNLKAFDGALDLGGHESGAFQIYRKTAIPMVTLRLSFAKGQALCGFAPPVVSTALPRISARSLTT
jgi:hypothetical protein